MYLGVLNTGYATSFFTPTILKDMGWTSLQAQIMSVPIYIAAAILTLCTAVLSDRFKHRFGFALGGCFVATVGYIILLAQKSANWRKILCFVRYHWWRIYNAAHLDRVAK